MTILYLSCSRNCFIPTIDQMMGVARLLVLYNSFFRLSHYLTSHARLIMPMLFFFYTELRNELNSVDAGPTTTMLTSTTSTREMPSSTRRLSAFMANTQLRSNRIWNVVLQCNRHLHQYHHCIRPSIRQAAVGKEIQTIGSVIYIFMCASSAV